MIIKYLDNFSLLLNRGRFCSVQCWIVLRKPHKYAPHPFTEKFPNVAVETSRLVVASDNHHNPQHGVKSTKGMTLLKTIKWFSPGRNLGAPY